MSDSWMQYNGIFYIKKTTNKHKKHYENQQHYDR